MKTLKKFEIIPQFCEFIPEKLEQGILYISESHRCVIHLCLCGCSGLTVTPLYLNQWTLHKNGDKVSLTPSIANNCFDCKSHYIITNNVANFV